MAGDLALVDVLVPRLFRRRREAPSRSPCSHADVVGTRCTAEERRLRAALQSTLTNWLLLARRRVSVIVPPAPSDAAGRPEHERSLSARRTARHGVHRALLARDAQHRTSARTSATSADASSCCVRACTDAPPSPRVERRLQALATVWTCRPSPPVTVVTQRRRLAAVVDVVFVPPVVPSRSSWCPAMESCRCRTVCLQSCQRAVRPAWARMRLTARNAGPGSAAAANSRAAPPSAGPRRRCR